jgi:cell division septation protein DedD
VAKNEDGEFELVLGNRQLVSVFLIAVILFGVFFSLGYIVARSSLGPSTIVDTHAQTSRPTVVEQADKPTASSPPAASSDSKPAGQNDSQKPSPVPAATEPVKPAPTPAPAPATQKNTEPGPAPVFGEPTPGDYLQIVATTRPDAEIISEALAKKGFRMLVAASPKEGIFRVLVGPLKDKAALADTRTALEAAGFKSPIVRKY